MAHQVHRPHAIQQIGYRQLLAALTTHSTKEDRVESLIKTCQKLDDGLDTRDDGLTLMPNCPESVCD